MKYVAVVLIAIAVAVSSTYFYLLPCEFEVEMFVVFADKRMCSNIVFSLEPK